jgi:cyclase
MGWIVLKKRVIPVLLLKNKRVVKGRQFKNFRDTGDAVSSAKVYNHQDADELIFLDIEARTNGSENLLDVVSDVARECFMPLTVGGNITSIKQIRDLLSIGADKVSINSYALENTNFIAEASNIFGSQCIVVSIDVKKENGIYNIYSHCGTKKHSVSLENYIVDVEQKGAGEILINSIDNDGMMSGYDIDLIKYVNRFTYLPVIASGGAGDFTHLIEIFDKTDVSAVACASMFHFGDNNPLRAKAYLKNHNIELKRI